MSSNSADTEGSSNVEDFVPLKAPFPWFGGKRRVASQVWAALGDVNNYVEPFGGSLAVLLGRPPQTHITRKETVNDADGFVCNAWRAIRSDPDGVAEWASGPLNETDLFARHLWLVNDGRSRLLHGLESDPMWFDVQIAGWWLWGIAGWIGSGWCSGRGPWVNDDGVIRKLSRTGETGNVRGVNRQLPHLGNAGQGVNRKRPHLGNAGRGVNRQLPHLGNAGRGVNRQLPHLGNAGRGVKRGQSDDLIDYMRQLADRLTNVNVCNGDWARVVTKGATSYGSTVGVFLDPPYLGEVRTADLYSVDDHHIADQVREWALRNGDNPRYRIVLAGYGTEHDHLIPETWERHSWAASGGYARNAVAKENAAKEMLWMSPHCVRTETRVQVCQGMLICASTRE